MGKKRVIDMDAFCFDVEVVDCLGFKGSILYIRLWSLAEDFGGYAPNYSSIALRMGAFKLSAKEIEVHISHLVEMDKIVEYEVNGKTYHWIKNFSNRQTLNNPAPPQNVPLPPWIDMEEKKYQSGKTWASYTINTDKLPVAYHHDTGKSETKQKRKETETKQKRKETPPLPKVVSEKCIEKMEKEFPSEDIQKHLQLFYDYLPNAKRAYKDLDAAFRNCMRKGWYSFKKGDGRHGELLT